MSLNKNLVDVRNKKGDNIDTISVGHRLSFHGRCLACHTHFGALNDGSLLIFDDSGELRVLRCRP